MDLDLIEKYKLGSYFKRLDELVDAMDDPFCVTCLGLYNGGKSTLLNALIDSKDYFRVADKVETKEIKHYDLDNIRYVDTPGLNANDFDDKEALKAAKYSNINLFVHNVATGDFSQPERECLEYFADKWVNVKSFLYGTIFVLSRKDECDDSQIKAVKDKITEQIKLIFGADMPPNIISVSAKTYLKGTEENKNLLVKSSNILKLKEMVLKKMAKMDYKDMRQKRIDRQKSSIYKKINSMINGSWKEIESLTKERKDLQNNIQNFVNNANNSLSQM